MKPVMEDALLRPATAPQINGSTNDRKTIRGALKDLGLPQIAGAEKITSGLIVRTESPWDTYREKIQYELAGPVIIAFRRSRPQKRVAIRQISNNCTHDLIFRFQLCQHPNLLSPREIYCTSNLIYGLFELIPLSLDHLVKHPNIYPNEPELASIMYQLLAGIAFLSNLRFTHQSLTCREVLLGGEGCLKIGRTQITIALDLPNFRPACLEYCMEYSQEQAEAQYLKAIPHILMGIMQKYSHSNSQTTTFVPDDWPADSISVEFFQASLSAKTIGFLQAHSLVVQCNPDTRKLMHLVRELCSYFIKPLNYLDYGQPR